MANSRYTMRFIHFIHFIHFIRFMRFKSYVYGEKPKRRVSRYGPLLVPRRLLCVTLLAIVSCQVSVHIPLPRINADGYLQRVEGGGLVADRPRVVRQEQPIEHVAA